MIRRGISRWGTETDTSTTRATPSTASSPLWLQLGRTLSSLPATAGQFARTDAAPAGFPGRRSSPAQIRTRKRFVLAASTSIALWSAILARPGSLTHDKPDLASYTHFLGSEAYGSGQPDSGTSAACPVLAGAVAALRSIYPHDAANANRHTAKVCGWIKNNCGVNPSGALGWTPDLGFGIIDTVAFAPGIAIIT